MSSRPKRSTFVAEDEVTPPSDITTVIQEVVVQGCDQLDRQDNITEPETAELATNLPLLSEALLPSNGNIHVVTEGTSPYRVIHVSQKWCAVTGFLVCDVIGQTLTLLQGQNTCHETLRHLRDEVTARKTFTVRLLNYTKQGRPFLNTLMLSPLEDDAGHGRSLYIGVVEASFLDDIGTPQQILQQRQRVQPPWKMQQQESWNDPTKSEESVNSSAQPLVSQGGRVERMPNRVQPFLVKLIDIVMSTHFEELLTFQPRSRTFKIIQPARFAKEVPSFCS